ncbi:tetratricopeptide (TPR) repeat protein [Scopulibacillus daqui]|uniref:Tetratricopeptide (TPR) repeat protein n=1 Tax=Scopulibacillus daqui TaxID=1469162 RepID=A0ABS2Q4N3_9BACL|nr:tetratricopeptide repeat protein [Scopulibacillus daqui]MBM7646915.1 tetratricopeptide (TPR) repeat protein [Scopulibacillus daqui]
MLTFLQKLEMIESENPPEKAVQLILDLVNEHPQDSDIQFQAAICCDRLGFESKAVPLYEKAIQLGLPEHQLKIAYTNLGSSLRVLGRYREALKCFETGLQHFPDFRPLTIFKAMTLYNLQESSQAVQMLLQQLIETTSRKDILYYEKALRYYSDHLDAVKS